MGVISTIKDMVGKDTPRNSRNVTNQVHELNKMCIAESHECVIIYIVNPHEFYIATKEEEEEEDATAARRFYIATKEEEEEAAASLLHGILHRH